MVQRSASLRAVPAVGSRATTAAAMVEAIVGCKWSIALLQLIASGCARPGAMLRACPGLSAKVMNERLER